MIQLKTLNKAPFGYNALSAIPAGLDHLCSHSGSFSMEIWKDVPGYESYYQVSSLGRFKSLKNRNGHDITLREIILKPGISNCGYARYVFCINKKRKMINAHRTVLITFNGMNSEKPFVNHINGVKSDNRLENLEWVTRSENQIHAYKTGLEKPCDNGLKKNVTILKNGRPVITYLSIREMCRCENIDRRSVLRYFAGKLKSVNNLTFRINEKS